ncbi:TPA: phage tail spike protein [Bacillus thuringiensis]|uniref:phage tail spike protein n=1 Tax=Bacillus thuringiensis TaxID=1428 RepID=UPI0037CF3818
MQNTELHIIDFKTQSIVATFQDQDYWDDVREWELKNNVDILEFKVFDGTRQSVTLQQQNLVLRQDRQGNVIPYTIEDEVEKTAKDRSITVRAVGSWTGLRKAGFIRPQKLEGLTAHQYVALATKGTKWQPGNIDYASFRTMTLDEFTDPLTLLKKTATLFNKELQYRVEVDGSTITGWYVDLIEKVGRVTRKEVELGKDLINVTRIEHTKNICTALLGFARGQDNEVITIEGINNGAPYIVDNEAFQRWSENGQHKYGFYQPETEGEIDAKRLMTLMKTEMEKRKNSSVGYEVDAIDIAEVFGLRHELIMKGDTIGIKDTAFTPALYLEARAIGGKESNSNPDRNSYTFGEYHEIVDYDAEMRKMYNRVQGLLESKAGKPLLDQLNKLVQEQEKKITEVVETNERVTEITEKLEEMVTNNSVTIHDGPNAPTEGLREGKSLWLDTSNGKPGILKIYRGGKWEPVNEDFSGLEKQIRDQVQKDVQATTNQLNKDVQNMERKAGELEKEFNTLKGSQQSLDRITKELIENDKGTQESIKQIKGDASKIEENIVLIGKSLDGFTQEVSQLKKTDDELKETTVRQQQSINGISNSISEVNKNLSGQSQKLNTLESTVDGNKKLIQSVETKVNDFSVGKRNILLGTTGLVRSHKPGVPTAEGFTIHVVPGVNEYLRNKSITISFKVRTKDYKKQGESPWVGLEMTVTYKDGSRAWLPCRVESEMKENQEYTMYSATHKLLDKDISGISGNSVIRHVAGEVEVKEFQVEMGTIATDYNPASEDAKKEMDGFKKLTTEITEEAGKTTKKLESLETNVNNIGGVNIITNNVIETKRFEVTPQNKGDASDNYRYASYSAVMDMNETYTISAKVTPTKGNFNEVSVYPYEKGLSIFVPIINGRIKHTFKKTDISTNRVLIYAGRAGETRDQGILLEDVQIERGSIATTYGPNPNMLLAEADFTRKTNEIIDDINGTKQRIEKTEKDQGTFRNQLAEFNRRADGYDATIKTINQTTSNHGSRLNTAEAQIKATSEELKGKITMKEARDYVGGVGSVNELRNASFASDWKYWDRNQDPGATANIDRNLTYKGNASFVFSTTGLTQNRWWGISGEFIPCQADEDFVASAYFITDGKPPAFDAGTGCFIEIEWWSADKRTRISTNRTRVNLVAHSWNRFEITAKAPANTGNIRFRVYNERNGRFWMACPMLQRGKVASEFWENPKDITDVDKLREDIAERIATEQFNKVVQEINRSITANSKGIELKADANTVYTKQQVDGTFAKDSFVKSLEAKILVNEKNINLSVKENNVISQINMSKETISIEARRINLIGFVTAQHIKGSVLEGVRIKTAPSGKERWVELNEQHINLYDKGVNRMYYGFYDTGNDVQPTVVLGKGSVGDLLGAMVFHQTTPGGNDFGKSFGRVGMVHRTENGNLLMNASIEFQRDGGHLLHHCWGNMQFRSNTLMRMETNGALDLLTNWTDVASNINMVATRNLDVMAHNQVWMRSNQTQWYQSGNGTFEFGKNGSNHMGITFNVNNPNDADIKFGTDIVLRSSNASGYTGNMQVKNYNGTQFRDMEVRDVKHYGRISQVSQGKLKTGVKDVKFDSLEKIMALDLKSFYMKTEIERLYEMRANREPGSPVPTYADINISYGFIVEKTDPVFQVPKGDAMDMYAISAIHIDATQNINRRLVVAERVIETQNDTIKTQNDRISNLETMLEQVLELLGKE